MDMIDFDGIDGTELSKDSEDGNLTNTATSLGDGEDKGELEFDENDDELKLGLKVSCEKEAYAVSMPRDGDQSQSTKANRLVKRTGCNAMIRFTVTDGVWEVTHLKKEHNHMFVAAKDQHFLKVNRIINKFDESSNASMPYAGVGLKKTYSYLREEKGAADNVGFTKRDFQNHVQTRKLNLIDTGDAQNVMNQFCHCQAEDPMFFHSESLDDDGRLANFFWRDGRSKLDYDCFADVVIFDTTCRTNKYNLIFAPFVGINHHRNNILFACAFLSDEETTTFIWLFEAFLKAMGNKHPKVIFTDQSQAMENAVRNVFPDTCHRLCSWHISKSATQNMGSLYSHPEFEGLFIKCLYDCETEFELESTWNEMIRRFDLAENKWLKALYEIREKWCPAFSLDIFTACIRFSERSESMNDILHKITHKTMNLTEFLCKYMKHCEEMRLTEKGEDYRCKHAMQQVRLRGSKILKQAADVYTITIYSLFEDEFFSSLTVHLERVSSVGTLHTYHLFEESHDRRHVVEFDATGCSVLCSCKMFQSKGWLCRHAFKVLNEWKITEIPAQYILSRWTKCAKKGSIGYRDQSLAKKRKLPLAVTRNNLLQRAYEAISLFIMNDEGERVVEKKVTEMLEAAQNFNETCGIYTDNGNSFRRICIGDQDEAHCSIDKIPILDASCVKEKGGTFARKKSSSEKQEKKQKKERVILPRPVHPFGIAMHTNLHSQAIMYSNMQTSIRAGTSNVIQATTSSNMPTSNGEGTSKVIQDFNSTVFDTHPNLTFSTMLLGNDQVSPLDKDTNA